MTSLAIPIRTFTSRDQGRKEKAHVTETDPDPDPDPDPKSKTRPKVVTKTPKGGGATRHPSNFGKDVVNKIITCTPKSLPAAVVVAASQTAEDVNPLNHVPWYHLAHLVPELSGMFPDFKAIRERIAVVTTKYWGVAGVKLTVGFLDSPSAALRRRILSHMNAWGATANVKFVESNNNPQVRIARDDGQDGGYWSYLGTDILHIHEDSPTMNLEGFTMRTPEAEYHRVVRHEAGHTLGAPHEHARKALVDLVESAKALEYFMRTQGWSEADVRAQVLTPLEESSLMGTPADQTSIMCYQVDASLTKDGNPIIGGTDIAPSDAVFMAKIYPKPKRKA